MDAFMALAGRYPLLTLAEETALLKKVAERKRGWVFASERLVLCNLRLVVKIARDFSYSTIPLQDLTSEGVIGLQLAIERFKPGKGAKLSTYAGFWIRQRIRRFIADFGREIRIPVHANERLFKFRKIRSQIVEELGREPTDEELSEVTGMSLDRIEKLSRSDATFVSIDAPASAEAVDGTLGDIIADENASMADRDAELHADFKIANDILSTYSKRERDIIVRRLGLHGGRAETLEELGRRFNVSRERIRQIQRDVTNAIRDAIERKDRLAGMGLGAVAES
jgi:RNA polymerase primary sigma factor